MNSCRRGLRNGVLVNPKLFILEKVNFGPHTKCWSNLVKSGQTWSTCYKLVLVGAGHYMLVKSVKAKLHITHLDEAFQVLKSYNMKLNPAKCSFGVSARKFLSFIVNSRGIEANPDKIKVVLNMLPPLNIKEI